jgi:hypothetical protein
MNPGIGYRKVYRLSLFTLRVSPSVVDSVEQDYAGGRGRSLAKVEHV